MKKLPRYTHKKRSIMSALHTPMIAAIVLLVLYITVLSLTSHYGV